MKHQKLKSKVKPFVKENRDILTHAVSGIGGFGLGVGSSAIANNDGLDNPVTTAEIICDDVEDAININSKTITADSQEVQNDDVIDEVNLEEVVSENENIKEFNYSNPTNHNASPKGIQETYNLGNDVPHINPIPTKITFDIDLKIQTSSTSKKSLTEDVIEVEAVSPNVEDASILSEVVKHEGMPLIGHYDYNKDGYIDAVIVDTNGDEYVDGIGLDFDYNRLPDTFILDVDGDDSLDIIIYDDNENGIDDSDDYELIDKAQRIEEFDNLEYYQETEILESGQIEEEPLFI